MVLAMYENTVINQHNLYLHFVTCTFYPALAFCEDRGFAMLSLSQSLFEDGGAYIELGAKNEGNELLYIINVPTDNSFCGF